MPRRSRRAVVPLLAGLLVLSGIAPAAAAAPPVVLDHALLITPGPPTMTIDPWPGGPSETVAVSASTTVEQSGEAVALSSLQPGDLLTVTGTLNCAADGACTLDASDIAAVRLTMTGMIEAPVSADPAGPDLFVLLMHPAGRDQSVVADGCGFGGLRYGDGVVLALGADGRAYWYAPEGVSLAAAAPDAPPPPLVTGVSPDSAVAGDGAQVTVRGCGFTGATAVSFGGVAATGFTVVADDRMTVTVPAGAGSVDVRVTGPTGTSATRSAAGFTYLDASAAAGPPVFGDLAGYGWAATAIDDLAARGILYGVAPGRFDPGGTVTRAQFAVLMQRLFDLPQPVQAVDFADLSPSGWDYAAAQALAADLPGQPAAGGGTDFDPGQPIDRQDVAGVIVRLLAAAGKLTPLTAAQAQSVLAQLPDGTDVAPAARIDVATAIADGILEGDPDGSFDPAGLLTRAQLAVVLERLAAGHLAGGA